MRTSLLLLAAVLQQRLDAAATGRPVHVPLAHHQRQRQSRHRDGHRALQQQPAAAAVGVHEATVPYHAYFVDLGVGGVAPGDWSFGVELDSGSSTTAVPSADCDNCPAEMEGYAPGTAACAGDACPPLTPGPLQCTSPDCPSSAFLSHGDCVGPAHLESVDPQRDSFGRRHGQQGWFPRIRVTLSCDVKTGGIYEIDDDLRVRDGSTFEAVHYTKRSTLCGPKSDACEAIAHLVVDALPSGGWSWWILSPAAFGSAVEDGFMTPLDTRIARWSAAVTPSTPRAAEGLGLFTEGEGCAKDGKLRDVTATVHAVNPTVPAYCCAAASTTQVTDACYDALVFADGSGVSGSVHRDAVHVSSAVSTSGLFTAYDHDNRLSPWFAGGTFRQSGVMTGIMGLGWAYGASVSPLVTELIAASGTGVDAFGLCLEDEFDAEGEASSSLDLGGAIANKYTGTMQYVPMVRKPEDGKYWTASPTGMSIGDSRDAVTVSIEDAESSFTGFYIDSGAPGVILPDAAAIPLFEGILRWVQDHRGGSRCKIYSTTSERTLSATFCEDVLFGESPFDCVHLSTEQDPDFDINMHFPAVKVHLQGSAGKPVTLTLEPSEYIYYAAGIVLGTQAPADGGERQGPGVPLICSLIGRWPASERSRKQYGMLGAAMLQRYYTLFDRTNLRFGFARHDSGSCAVVETQEARSSIAAQCAARATSGCSGCVGFIDDASPSAGYCLWCPSSGTCNEYTHMSAQFPCSEAQGVQATGLDAAPGGRCATPRDPTDVLLDGASIIATPCQDGSVGPSRFDGMLRPSGSEISGHPSYEYVGGANAGWRMFYSESLIDGAGSRLAAGWYVDTDLDPTNGCVASIACGSRSGGIDCPLPPDLEMWSSYCGADLGFINRRWEIRTLSSTSAEPRAISAISAGCQSLYHTMMNFVRTTVGDCGVTESVVGSFLAECGSVQIHVHGVGPTASPETTVESGQEVVRGLSETVAYSGCAFEPLSGQNAVQVDDLAFVLAGLDTACTDDTPALDGRFVSPTAGGATFIRTSGTDAPALTLTATEDAGSGSFVVDSNQFQDCVGADALRIVRADAHPSANGCYRRSATVLANGFPTWQQEGGDGQIYWYQGSDRGLWLMGPSRPNGYTGSVGYYKSQSIFASAAPHAPPSTTGWFVYDAGSSTWIDAGVLRMVPAGSTDCGLWVVGAGPPHVDANGCYSYDAERIENGHGVWVSDESEWVIYYHPPSSTWLMYVSTLPTLLVSQYYYQSAATLSAATGPPSSGWHRIGGDHVDLQIGSLSTVVAVQSASAAPGNGVQRLQSGQWSVLCGTAWKPVYASVLAVPSGAAGPTDSGTCSTQLAVFAEASNDVCCRAPAVCDIATGVPSVCSPACAQLAGPFVNQCGAWLRGPAVGFQLGAIVDFIDGCGSKGGGH